MELKVIDFGNKKPLDRAYSNDAGIDLYANIKQPIIIPPGRIVRIPLGIGLELPIGTCALIMPRSSMTMKNLDCKVAPIDSSYRGEIHSILQNCNQRCFIIKPGDCVGQMVIFSIITPTLVTEYHERGDKNFGSSGHSL